VAVLAGVARADRIEGVALPLYHGDHDWLAALDEIAGLGATHVSLPVFWRQSDVRANQVYPDPAVTVADDRLRAVIRHAHARNLRVLLFPIIELDVVKRGEWRGTLVPADPAAWWASYERFVLHYAAIAAEEKVAILSVGSELGATEKWRERWWHLLGRVERSFPGELLYSANWDHYGAVTFWDRLDYVGVSAYFGVTTRADADEAELLRGWKRELGTLLAFARGLKKPLVLTEVGLPSRDGAATAPWDYTRRAAVDLEEQRRGYAAFFAAWRAQPALGGAFVWHWFGEGGLGDGSYTPRGKPAEQVVRRAYGGTGILPR
jgi:hypothetical protein